MDIHPRFSFEPEYKSRPQSELLHKLGHQLLEMGVLDLAREYLKMAKQVCPPLSPGLHSKAEQIDLDFLNDGPCSDKNIQGL
ncbi:MAG: hypothetical protein AB7I41_09080 [Candidatus Sericytochromatia bacterium]